MLSRCQRILLKVIHRSNCNYTHNFTYVQDGLIKSEPLLVSQQIMLQCVPIMLHLSDLSVTHLIYHENVQFYTIIKHFIGYIFMYDVLT